VRLAQGQIRPLLASRAVRAAADADGCRRRKIRTRHESAVANEKFDLQALARAYTGFAAATSEAM